MELIELNKPLYQAYLLKEDLRMFWSLDAKTCEVFLTDWMKQARFMGNKQFDKLASSFEKHRKGLLSYFKHRMSTGPLEGLNNKIKCLNGWLMDFEIMNILKLDVTTSMSNPQKSFHIHE